jgi:ABC-type sugar transport system substrate-binding protein
MLSFDSDASPTGSRRIRFVSPATETEVARLLVDSLIDATQGVGEVVIVTGAAEAPNRNAWTFRIQRLLESSYPKIRLLDTIVTEENAERTREKTESILRKRPDLAAVISLGETTLPVVARTVRDAGLRGKVFVSGIGLPSTVSEFVADGTIPSFVSWNPVDLGYLAVHAAKAARGGSLKSGPSTFGRLTTIQVTEDEIILGSPVRFGRDNADPPPY